MSLGAMCFFLRLRWRRIRLARHPDHSAGPRGEPASVYDPGGKNGTRFLVMQYVIGPAPADHSKGCLVAEGHS